MLLYNTIAKVLYLHYLCCMETRTTHTRRIQTAFRLEEGLLRRLKLKAKANKQSLNSYVEELLMADSPAEPSWPQMELNEEIDPRLREMMLPRAFTAEELEDERLAYILNK